MPGQKFLSGECQEIVESAAVVDEPPIYCDVRPTTVWEVWSWWAHGHWWSRHKEIWLDYAHAVECAKQRAKTPGHVKVRIVKIELS